MVLLVLFAFVSGIITVLSPCILPILPIILTSTIGDQKIGLLRPIGVILGFVFSFTFFTLFLSSLVRFLGVSADALRLFSVVVIAIFGVSLLLPGFQLFVEKMFSSLARFMPQTQNKSGLLGGVIIGLSVGLLWTPCVGPILASVISLAITGEVTFDAFLITLAYSLGTAIPMFLIMFGGQNVLRKVPWLLAKLGVIQKLFGVLMIITALAIFFNFDRKFQTFILEKFPEYGSGLTQLEDNDLIQKELEEMNENKTLNRQTSGVNLSDGPTAPEIISGGEWINSSELTIAGLKGKVVLIDFWTYSCINCQRTLPYLRDWHSKYKEKGLVIIGVHSPEFEFEKSVKNVKNAVGDFGIEYAVVQDNDFTTWRNYNNRYWPAKYLIDANGKIRYTHFGEGRYQETEENIQLLLREAGYDVGIDVGSEDPALTLPGFGDRQTPETYLGSQRAERFDLGELKNGPGIFELNNKPPTDTFSLGGHWNIEDEYSESSQGSTLVLNFNAKKVHLVMTPARAGDKVAVSVDGVFVKDIILDEAGLYDLVEMEKKSRGVVRLEFKNSGTRIYAFTFGS